MRYVHRIDTAFRVDWAGTGKKGNGREESWEDGWEC